MKSLNEGPRLVKHWMEVAIYDTGRMKRETQVLKDGILWKNGNIVSVKC